MSKKKNAKPAPTTKCVVASANTGAESIILLLALFLIRGTRNQNIKKGMKKHEY